MRASSRAICRGWQSSWKARGSRRVKRSSAVTENCQMDFTGKVALVTGGGNGIGRAASAAFARHGAKVVVVDRDAAGAEATAGIIRQSGGDAIAVTADVTKAADVKAYVRAAIE